MMDCEKMSLRSIRIAEKLTQVEMAAVMRVSYALYKKIDNNERTPSASFMRKFKAAFPYISADIFFPEGG